MPRHWFKNQPVAVTVHDGLVAGQFKLDWYSDRLIPAIPEKADMPRSGLHFSPQ
ncbi:hypothetical protein [Skermanella rosea]|nr:hypothetical protein [Skermanella rosea]